MEESVCLETSAPVLEGEETSESRDLDSPEFLTSWIQQHGQEFDGVTFKMALKLAESGGEVDEKDLKEVRGKIPADQDIFEYHSMCMEKLRETLNKIGLDIYRSLRRLNRRGRIVSLGNDAVTEISSYTLIRSEKLWAKYHRLKMIEQSVARLANQTRIAAGNVRPAEKAPEQDEPKMVMDVVEAKLQTAAQEIANRIAEIAGDHPINPNTRFGEKLGFSFRLYKNGKNYTLAITSNLRGFRMNFISHAGEFKRIAARLRHLDYQRLHMSFTEEQTLRKHASK